MQTALSSIWTRVVVATFYIDNRYTTTAMNNISYIFP